MASKSDFEHVDADEDSGALELDTINTETIDDLESGKSSVSASARLIRKRSGDAAKSPAPTSRRSAAKRAKRDGSGINTNDNLDDDSDSEDENEDDDDDELGRAKPAKEKMKKSLCTRMFCCLCFASCCYKNDNKHCCAKWCRGTKHLLLGLLLNVLLFASVVAASISYTVYVFRSTEEGTNVVHFFNTTYVTEYIIGTPDGSLGYDIRLWAINTIITQTATVSLLAIASVFAGFNFIRRLVLCPHQDRLMPVVLSLVILGLTVAASIVVATTRQDNRVLVEQSNSLATIIDDYSKWLTGAPTATHSAPNTGSPANTTSPATPGSPNTGQNYIDSLNQISTNFLSAVFSKLPENVRIYALLVVLCLFSFWNMFQ